MRDWLRNLWNAALLRTDAFERLRADPDAFLRGFLLIIAVALIAALPRLVVNLANSVFSTGAPEAIELQMDYRSGLREARPWLERVGIPAAVLDQVIAEAETGADVGTTIAQQVQGLPTAFPRPLARTLLVAGSWLTRPFTGAPFPLAAAVLNTWLGYGIFVMLAAKLLGGRGSLAPFFGLTALFAAPHVLSVFALIPVAGPILAAAGFIWGLVIYVKATAVSHEMSWERGLLAAVLPFLLAAALLLALLAGIAAVGLMVLPA